MDPRKTGDADWTGGEHHAVWLRLSYDERLRWLERAILFVSQFAGVAQCGTPRRERVIVSDKKTSGE